MKPSTAVRHLVEMATMANDRLALRDSEVGWPLEELWVGGELLELRSDLEAGSVVLVLDLPPEELPWLAMHPAAEWVGAQLRLGKRPFFWSYRPVLWPAWNQRNRRVARFWSARSGIDTAVLDALRDGRVDEVPVVEPSTDELAGPAQGGGRCLRDSSAQGACGLLGHRLASAAQRTRDLPRGPALAGRPGRGRDRRCAA